MDSYANLINKLGARNDVTNINFNLLSSSNLCNIYQGDGVAKKIIDIKSKDMIREWIKFEKDTDGLILDVMNSLNVKQEILKALQFNKILGGSIIYMMLDDGKDPIESVDLNSIKSIQKIKAYKRTDFSVLSYDVFGEPEIIQIIKKYDGGTIDVHASRCLAFTGELALKDYSIASNTEYWGISEIQAMFNYLGKLGLSMQSIYDMLIKSNIDLLKIDDLGAKLEINEKEGQSQVDKQIMALNKIRSVAQIMVIDGNDEYQVINQNFSNIEKPLESIFLMISTVSGIPESVFFGRSPQGLNATGNNEVRRYYDTIKNDQELILLNPLNYLKDIIVNSSEYGIAENDYNLKFQPLWQQTEKEIAETKKITAETDNIYINNGVIDPSEVRQARFGGEEYSSDLMVEGDIETDQNLENEDQPTN